MESLGRFNEVALDSLFLYGFILCRMFQFEEGAFKMSEAVRDLEATKGV